MNRKKPNRLFVKFYAYSTKHNDPNYLFTFKVNNEYHATKLAKDFNAKAAWYLIVDRVTNDVKFNKRLYLGW